MMEQHKCESCGALFDRAKYETEGRGECHGSPSYAAYGVCPACGSEDYHLQQICDGCGQTVTYDLIEGLCDTCGADIKERALQDIRALLSGYGELERAYLRVMLEDCFLREALI